MQPAQNSNVGDRENLSAGSTESRPKRLPPDSLPCQRTLGSWRLTELAGTGQFSQVYFAQPCDRETAEEAIYATPSDYAIKQLRPEFSDDLDAVSRFRQEAVIGITVEHPNVATVLSAHFEGNPSFFVMPRLQGMTLRQHLNSIGTLEVPLALWITRQIASGLAALHDAGWLHADVKPDNLFIAPDGHVTLFDFGLSVSTREAGVGDVRGTYEYAAPESFTSMHGLSPASDVYSLGILLFELLTGRRPFDGSPPSLVESHVNQIPASVRDVSKRIPKELAQLVSRMLAKQSSRRPVCGDELQDQLARLEIQMFAQRVA